MRDRYKKPLRLILTLLFIASLAACQLHADPEPTEPIATEYQATADESAVITEPTEEVVTVAPTQPPTSPSAEEVLSGGSSDPNNIYDATGFVNIKDIIPEAQTDIRYASSHNFVGEPVNGYDEPVALMTKEAAAALMSANADLKEQGYTVKIFDAYRPQRAVDNFVSWSNDWDDTRTKSEFYPEMDKSSLFAGGYIAAYSGHSHGSTIDLTLVDLDTGEEVDMGGDFDYFGASSHPDYYGVTPEQYENRMTLRNAMINNGFSPLSTEWWHFSLNSDPYPYTYFDFPVSTASLNN